MVVPQNTPKWSFLVGTNGVWSLFKGTPIYTQPSLTQQYHLPRTQATSELSSRKLHHLSLLQQKKRYGQSMPKLVHLWKLTWNRKIIQLNREIIFQTCSFGVPCSIFQGVLTVAEVGCCCVHLLCCHLLLSHCWGMYGTEFVPPGREKWLGRDQVT